MIETNLSTPLRQGAFVRFVTPYNPVGEELSGKQYGVVVSADRFNKSGITKVIVCPALRDDRKKATPEMGVLTVIEGRPYWLRPDLIRSVGLSYVAPVKSWADDVTELLVAPDCFKDVVSRFFGLVRPSLERLNDAYASHLRYGGVSMLQNVAYLDDYHQTPHATGLCLSTAEDMRRTGMMLVMRRRTFMDKFNEKYHVRAEYKNYPGYVETSSIYSLSVFRAGNRRDTIGVLPQQRLDPVFEKITRILTPDFGPSVSSLKSNLPDDLQGQDPRTPAFVPARTGFWGHKYD